MSEEKINQQVKRISLMKTNNLTIDRFMAIDLIFSYEILIGFRVNQTLILAVENYTGNDYSTEFKKVKPLGWSHNTNVHLGKLKRFYKNKVSILEYSKDGFIQLLEKIDFNFSKEWNKLELDIIKK